MDSPEPISQLKALLHEVSTNLNGTLANFYKFGFHIRQIESVLGSYSVAEKPVQFEECSKMVKDLLLIQSVLRQIDFLVKSQEDKLAMNNYMNPYNSYLKYAEYPVPDWSQYKPGFKFKGIISHIVNASKGLFYLVNRNSSSAFSSIFDALQKKVGLLATKGPLKNGTLMAAKVDDSLARVLIENNDNSEKMFLIDLGETIYIDGFTEFYEIPLHYKTLPSQAILCKIKDLPKKATAANFLSSNMYNQFDFEVVGFDNHILHVRVLDNLASLKTRSKKSASATNPFLSDLSLEDEFEDTLQSVTVNDDVLTDEQRQILFEDTETTENAMVAVLGYDPKDEIRYCKHYDPKTGGCFKGASCTLVHQKPLEDGWTRDREKTTCDIAGKLPIPAVGSQLFIMPTHANDVHIFYGHILNPEYAQLDKISLKAFQKEINCATNIKKYKPFSSSVLPCLGELVLADYNGYYYRAKILSLNTEAADVFYLDYGNRETVPLSKIFKWEKLFEAIPFQSFLFRIGNIKPNPAKTQSKRSSLLMDNIDHKRLRVEVLDNTSEIVVRAYFDDMDLGALMCIGGFALMKEEDQPPKKKGILPG